MRLLHLSDIHFGAEDTAALAALPAFLASRPHDLIVITGDVTLAGRRREFAAARQWIETLPAPVLMAPGNHDVPTWHVGDRLIRPFRRFDQLPGAASDVHLSDLAAVHRLQTAHGLQWRLNWSHGAVRQRHLDELLQLLHASPERRWTLLACHHPLVDLADHPIQGRTRGGARALEQLAAAGVQLILHGHVHIPAVTALPAGARTMLMVGAGTLSNRVRGEPAGFNSIILSEKDATIDLMVFDGAQFVAGGPPRTIAR